MIIWTKIWRERINVACDPYALSVVLHDLFMICSYGSKLHNIIGAASKVNETAANLKDDALFNNIKKELLAVFKYPILFL